MYSQRDNRITESQKIIPGANRTNLYLNLLSDKNVAVVTNHTGMIENTHIVDSLLSLGINITKIFSPEHGFRGDHSAGEEVKNKTESKSELLIISLYGKSKKLDPNDIRDIDVVLFDIQDVGVRFFTYISTLSYVIDACAKANKLLIVLDRPNPNIHYIDGPILQKDCESFVGMHPIPVVYGMTIGEYANMVNGENWMNNEQKCAIRVIACDNYSRNKEYSLPIKPSPNLPNDKSVNLYPSLALFEGTSVSVGRGTDMPFQMFGSPFFKTSENYFIPKTVLGAKKPKHEGLKCFKGTFNYDKKLNCLNLDWIIWAYNNTLIERDNFFTNYFRLLIGTDKTVQQIKKGMSQDEIKATWKNGIEQFKEIRKKYLLYDYK
ncbi:exo-beta-N-acetylmuramidase NamZ family protein [Ichthyobacterium seriolicida]|uniref:exo-beta-N-acetylmuramidase NamZ family protein n=1 Tax=Ichthyobacterium seriolicida TaxID=242600 RepID=UPI001E4ED381|nr:DUF1343 domain-containing protein [Ichthyobacterium seriolicida]